MLSTLMDGEAVAARLAGEVRIFRKLRVQLCFRRRHLAGRECDAIDEADDAFRHRAKIVRHVGSEGHGTKAAAALGLVLAAAVMLEHELAALTHQQYMQARDAAVLFEARKPLADEFRRWRCEGARRRQQATAERGKKVTAAKAGQ
jgi:hypothetical protein